MNPARDHKPSLNQAQIDHLTKEIAERTRNLRGLYSFDFLIRDRRHVEVVAVERRTSTTYRKQRR
jgi:hypothetical protein